MQLEIDKLKSESLDQKAKIAELESENSKLKNSYSSLNQGLKHNQSEILNKL